MTKTQSIPILKTNSVPDRNTTLSEKEQECFGQLKEATSHWSDSWLDDPCLVRYLKATKWNVPHALARIEKTLDWRKEFKPLEITPDEVAHEASSGKQFINGFDKEGRPILYLVPKRENSRATDTKLKFVVYNLEKAIQLMPPGVESLVIILDYDEMTVLNAPSPSIGRKFLSILSEHYPERLGLGFIVNPTWYLSVFFSIVSPFMDPVTKAKIHMVPKGNEEKDHQVKKVDNLLEYIEHDMLLDHYGGSHQFEWDFETYWHHLNS